MEMKQMRTIGVVENPADMNGMNKMHMMNMYATYPTGMYNPNTGFGEAMAITMVCHSTIGRAQIIKPMHHLQTTTTTTTTTM
eukprot:8224146-Ditylum_brightwellii.AAC.1